MRRYILSFICFFLFSSVAFTQEHPHEQPAHGTEQASPPAEGHEEAGCGIEEKHGFDPGATAFHHISDQNLYNIGPWSLPLPCILYVPGEGFHTFSSGQFHIGHHGDGHMAVNRFVLVGGMVKRVTDPSFPTEAVEIGGFATKAEMQDNGKEKDVTYVCYQNQLYQADGKSTADGGLFGGGITSFYDFSISKNVVSMLVVFLLLAWMFISIANTYKKRDGMAPKGIQGFIEPIILFLRDEVAKPFIGKKWAQYLPFLLSLFFFILGLNLFGQIPFFGGSNVTGNLAFTAVLAIITFLVVNLSGNKHYWEHVLWMPGVPPILKVLILTPVEFLGIFIKPFTLMLRLAANITAGHIVITIFISLIFIFGNLGESPGAAWGTSIGTILLTLFMMAIELLVAFIQAFVFTLLTASYIGAATEEHHHAEEHH